MLRFVTQIERKITYFNAIEYTYEFNIDIAEAFRRYQNVNNPHIVRNRSYANDPRVLELAIQEIYTDVNRDFLRFIGLSEISEVNARGGRIDLRIQMFSLDNNNAVANGLVRGREDGIRGISGYIHENASRRNFVRDFGNLLDSVTQSSGISSENLQIVVSANYTTRRMIEEGRRQVLRNGNANPRRLQQRLFNQRNSIPSRELPQNYRNTLRNSYAARIAQRRNDAFNAARDQYEQLNYLFEQNNH